jgi:hypothetical protein
MHAYSYTHIHTRIFINTNSYTHIHTHIFIHAYSYTHIHIQTFIHSYSYTQTSRISIAFTPVHAVEVHALHMYIVSMLMLFICCRCQHFHTWTSDYQLYNNFAHACGSRHDCCREGCMERRGRHESHEQPKD